MKCSLNGLGQLPPCGCTMATWCDAHRPEIFDWLKRSLTGLDSGSSAGIRSVLPFGSPFVSSEHVYRGVSFHAAKSTLILALLLLCAAALSAQTSGEKTADWVSYGTAAVNPTVAAVKAIRSADRWCRLTQLGISELVGNGSTLTLKRLVNSQRPCVGCSADGFPSGHTMNSVIGVSSGWQVGVMFSLGTAELRTAAHRHTPWQVLAGAAIGGMSEYLGHLVKCGE